MRLTDDSIVLTPKKLVNKSQAYFRSAKWQAVEREASEDIAAGRTHEFNNADDLIAGLEKHRRKK